MDHFLCIETATEVCSIAIGNREGIISVQETEKKNSHTETITLFIARCLEKAGLTLADLMAIGISDGPGSYTGLRVGTSAAKGIAYGAGLPIIAIPTLAGLAYGVKSHASTDDVIIPMIDARRMEIYYSVYSHAMEELYPVNNMILEDHSLNEIGDGRTLIITGNGAHKVENQHYEGEIVHFPSHCNAVNLISLCHDAWDNGITEDIAYYSPSYFKAPNITKSKKNFFD